MKQSFFGILLITFLVFLGCKNIDISQLPEYQSGMIHFENQDYKRAEEVFQSLANKYSQNSRIYFMLGKTQFYLKDMEQANKNLKKSLKKDPYFCPALLWAARFSLIENNFSQAGEYLDQIIKMNPEHPEANLFKARLLLDQGQTDQAIAFLKQCDHGEELYAEIYYELGKIYLDNEQTSQGTDYLNKAMDLTSHPDLQDDINQKLSEVLK
ncbi:MAG: tetratricopeptide repeat protein [Spirochaetes bacterium]|nr:tetratricopeptide repeat protein [Spirochaetota bacterium]